jgi:RNA polymerase sigma-70 factor, ECF subfamily
VTIQEESRAARPGLGDGLDHARHDSDRDRQLVLAFLGGDVDAFSVIASDHYANLMAQARRQLGPTGQVEDAVQETLERALRGIRKFGLTGEYRLGPWLSRILFNVCVDQRSRSARQVRLLQTAAAQPVLEDDVANRVSDPKTVEIVRNALQDLPNAHRRAVLLRELDGLAYAEVAEAENISVENARARVARGKSSLRRALHSIRGVVLLPLPVFRLFGRVRNAIFGFGHGAKSVTDPGSRLARTSSGPSLVDQVAGRLVNTPFGQSAWAIMSSPPKGTLMFGLAATVATVSASTVLLNQPSAEARVPAPATAAVSSTLTPLGAATSLSTPAAVTTPTSKSSTVAAAAQTPSSTYSWVDPGSQASGSAGTTALASLPAAPTCVAEDSVPAPGPDFSYGAPLGIADALAVGNSPTTDLSMAGTSISFDAPLSVTPFGGDGSTSTIFSLSASACFSSSGWLTALVTSTDPSADVSVELVGVLEEVIGSPGDLGYVFRGVVVSQGEQSSLLAGSQFVAQLALAEPANTAQLTVVFLGGPETTTSTSGTSGDVAASGLVPSLSEISTTGSSPTSTSGSGSGPDVVPAFAPLVSPISTRS